MHKLHRSKILHRIGPFIVEGCKDKRIQTKHHVVNNTFVCQFSYTHFDGLDIRYIKTS